MFVSRLLTAAVLAGVLCASTGFAAVPGAKTKANAPANPKSHAHHLLQAEEDLVLAEGSLVSQNTQQAHKHVAAAIKQLEAAIQHHHKHHISQPSNSGLSGVANRAHHHKHHATLKQAVAELQAAEKQLTSGNAAAASKDIQLAAKTIKAAVASHHHLIKT